MQAQPSRPLIDDLLWMQNSVIFLVLIQITLFAFCSLVFFFFAKTLYLAIASNTYSSL